MIRVSFLKDCVDVRGDFCAAIAPVYFERSSATACQPHFGELPHDEAPTVASVNVVKANYDVIANGKRVELALDPHQSLVRQVVPSISRERPPRGAARCPA